jgi:DNA-binding winged helix-turn-helix (wHTH) protein/tetratricopeptide (TPR) repeat protein
VFRFAGFELDPVRAELRGASGVAIKLRPKTFEMLRLFAANAGRVLSKKELMEAIWPNVHVGEDNLFQCVREIRAALGDDQRQMIKLVSGRGYLFDVPIGKAEPPAPVVVSELAPASVAPMAAAVSQTIEPAVVARSRRPVGLRRTAVIAAGFAVCAIIGLAAAAPTFRPLLIVTPPRIAVLPIVDESSDPRNAVVAAEVTDRLIDGFARIENIRVVAPQGGAAAGGFKLASATPSEPADFVVRGELQRGPQAWTLRVRLIKAATGEVQSVAMASVDFTGIDPQIQQSRLAAGAGHQLAQQLNKLLDARAQPKGAADSSGKAAIEQAVASINQTTRERFGVAQTILQNALAGEPDNIDVAVALAALQMRGIQMVWYSPAEAIAAEAQAGTTLERALRGHPNSIPVLEAYCRYLSATNRFVDSLVACAKALNFDPWNGSALYLIGLGQIHLGRFEDSLATFEQADRFDTPQVSRWTWLLGAGWANVMIGRTEDALPWLQRSIAITAASGRSHMLTAAIYQQLGRTDEAKAAMQKGLELRPGTTALNVSPPTKNVSPLFLDATAKIIRLMVDAGLPER